MSERDDTIRDVARRLRPVVRETRFARPRVRAFYDDWLAERRLPDGPAGFLHAVVSTAGLMAAEPNAFDPGIDADALALAVGALGAAEMALEFLAAAASDRIVELRDDGSADLETADKRLMEMTLQALGLGQDSTRAILHSGTLHSLTTPNAFWTDPGDLLPAILLARRRLCKITALNSQEVPVLGSGFLIGPSTILTNYHVVGHLPDQVRAGRLLIRFDFSPTTGLEKATDSEYRPAKDWRTAFSQRGSEGPDADYWWDDLTARDDWLHQVEGKLDYAAIRLEGAPGLQRGWYRLEDLTADQPSGAWVLHHPSGDGHTITRGVVKLPVPGGHRIFHDADTEKGSSGGLVLDQRGLPVGLHYLGLRAGKEPSKQEQVNRVINVAIALRAIAADLRAQQGVMQKIADSGELVLPRGCLDGRRPVFGRKEFLGKLHELSWGDRRMMMVHPPLEVPLHPGKSFTIDIVRHIFRAPEHHHIVFRAGELKADALKVARDTLATFAPDRANLLPAEPDTTTPAYVRKLVIEFGRAIAERLDNRMVWIMLDDLDKHTLSDASGREFLATLYNQIERLPNVRVILIGLPDAAAISGIDENNVIRSYISPADVSGFEDQFAAWLNERGARDRPISEDAAQLLAGMVTSYAGEKAPLLHMAEFVTQHFQPVADRIFGGVERPEADV